MESPTEGTYTQQQQELDMRLTEHCAIHQLWKAEYQKWVCVIRLSTLRYLYLTYLSGDMRVLITVAS